jgi:hypothetical protein
MNKLSILAIVKKLPFDDKKTVFKDRDIEVQIFRPSILSKRFKNYDVNKNFQIWLKENDREFRPNHLRVMIDLNLRVRSRPDLKEKLLLAFDNIFYGKDPLQELEELNNENFEHYLNPLVIIGVLSQLFIVEQEYCYNKQSNFEPPTLFYQGWVREFIDNPKEIDNLCMSVCSGQPALVKYVGKENKKNKLYIKDLNSLWYLRKTSS